MTHDRNIFFCLTRINRIDMIKKYNGYLISDKKIKGYNTIKNFLEIKKEL